MDKLYLYLVDEHTGMPCLDPRGTYPLVITKPKEALLRFLPLMHLSLAAMSLINQGAGLAHIFGVPVPRIPQGLRQEVKKLIKGLDAVASAKQFDCLQSTFQSEGGDKGDAGGAGGPEKVRGALLREFEAFLKDKDPKGEYSGLQRVMTQDGTVCWTTKEGTTKIEEEGLKSFESAIHDKGQQVALAARRNEELLRELEGEKMKVAEALSMLSSAPAASVPLQLPGSPFDVRN